MSYSYWIDILESSDIDTGDDTHALLELSADFYFVRAEGSPGWTMGIGIEFVDGEDPTKGLPDQEFTRVAFKFIY